MLSRRSFCTASLSLPFLATGARSARAEEPGDDHFLLLILLAQGASVTEFFDGRPPEWTTDHKLVVNPYLGFDGTKPKDFFSEATFSDELLSVAKEGDMPWRDAEGGATLGRSPTRVLLPFKDELTIFNGVHMDPDGDGHDRNLQYLLAGSHTGEDHLFDQINAGRYPLSYVQFGDNPFIPIFDNTGSGLRFSSVSLFKSYLKSFTERGGAFPLGPHAHKYASERYASLAKGRVHLPFFKGIDQLGRALGFAAETHQTLRSLPSVKDGDKVPGHHLTIDSCLGFFQQRMTNVGVIVVDDAYFDAHDEKSMKETPFAFLLAADTIRYAIERLKATPWRSSSLFEHTTLLATSEFSRTLRQDAAPDITKSGADHNTGTNTIIGAGRSFRNVRGRVLGRTDFQTLEEPLSEARWRFEPKTKRPIKLIGMPFDHASLATPAARPEQYSIHNYLSYANVMNSLLALQFGVKDPPRFQDGGKPKLIPALG